MVSGRAVALFLLLVWQREVGAAEERPFISNGGWQTFPSDLLVHPGPCNIDIRDKTLTQQEFLAQYAYTRPLVIRDAADNDLFRALTERYANFSPSCFKHQQPPTLPFEEKHFSRVIF
jgi:hypothetical protein